MKNTRLKVLIDLFVYNPKDKLHTLTEDILFKLIDADPTTQKNEGKDIKVGKYTNWIIKNYLKNIDNFEKYRKLYVEDLYKLTLDLKKFDRFKHKFNLEDRNIDNHTRDTLYDLVKNLDSSLLSTTKKERKVLDVHPGADLFFDGDIWRVVKIHRDDKLGKEAACFYGGYNEETRWCTSAPGTNYFNSYIRRGPLYVILNKNDNLFGSKTGLPLERYQFHFEDYMFMDIDDRPIDLVEYFLGSMSELKSIFKKTFLNVLTFDIKKLTVDDSDNEMPGKFATIYGMETLLTSLPNTIEELIIRNYNNNNFNFTIPKKINKLKNLKMVLLDNCVSKVSEELFLLPKLKFLSIINNNKLKTIPNVISPSVQFLSLKGCNNVKLSETLLKNGVLIGDKMWHLTN